MAFKMYFFFFSDEKGLYVGAVCEFTCSIKLAHVYCNAISGQCECDKKYPVKLNNPYAGCTKRKSQKTNFPEYFLHYSPSSDEY